MINKIVSIVFCVLLIGCHSNSVENSLKVDNTDRLIDEAFKMALSQNDFRLYKTLGRRPVVPGLETESIAKLEKACGLKPLTGYGDSYRDTSEKESRLEKFKFAKQYNLKMIKYCSM